MVCAGGSNGSDSAVNTETGTSEVVKIMVSETDMADYCKFHGRK